MAVRAASDSGRIPSARLIAIRSLTVAALNGHIFGNNDSFGANDRFDAQGGMD